MAVIISCTSDVTLPTQSGTRLALRVPPPQQNANSSNSLILVTPMSSPALGQGLGRVSYQREMLSTCTLNAAFQPVVHPAEGCFTSPILSPFVYEADTWVSDTG